MARAGANGLGRVISPYMIAEEVAEYLRCDSKTVYRYKTEGRLRAYHRAGLHGDLLFRREDVERLAVPEVAAPERDEESEFDEVREWLAEGLPADYDPTRDSGCQLQVIEGDFPSDLSGSVDTRLYGEMRSR